MKGEQEFAERIAVWLRKKYPKAIYNIVANVKRKGPDIIVTKKHEGDILLQIDTKLADYYNIIGEGLSHLWETDKKVPTFIAVPYSTMRSKNWDSEEFVKMFKYFDIRIGVLVLQENAKITVKHNPWRGSVRFR